MLWIRELMIYANEAFLHTQLLRKSNALQIFPFKLLCLIESKDPRLEQ